MGDGGGGIILSDSEGVLFCLYVALFLYIATYG